VTRRRLELLALPARLGRQSTEPHDPDRRWRGWRARDVVIGETHAERARRILSAKLARQIAFESAAKGAP